MQEKSSWAQPPCPGQLGPTEDPAFIINLSCEFRWGKACGGSCQNSQEKDSVISLSSVTLDKVFSINAADHDVFCVCDRQTKLPFLISEGEKKGHLFDIFHNHFTCLPPMESARDPLPLFPGRAGSLWANKAPFLKDIFNLGTVSVIVDCPFNSPSTF